MMQQMWHRLQLMIAQGRGVRVTHEKIQVKIMDGETPPNVDRVEPYGFSYRPHPNCQAYVVFPSGDRSRGFAIVVADKQYNVELEEGEVCLHDDLGQKVHLTRDGIVIDGAGLPITIQNTPKVRMQTDLEVTGNIKDQCDSTGQTMAGMRAIYNGHTHPGDSGGTTGNPNQDM
jgi:phage baseplate assembly protein V